MPATAKPAKTIDAASEPAGAAEIISLGCRLNIAEGDEIKRLAGANGVHDIVVVNSCAVTNEAVRQTRQTIRKNRKLNPDARIIVTGCAAQVEPDAFANMPEVDSVLGNREKLDPASWASIAAHTDTNMLAVNDIMGVRETAPQFVDGYGDRARAFLQIQNGCDHRCTFCIIPYGRGNSRSTPIRDIVETAKRLTAAGHAEIVLTGVDITSWGHDLEGAPRLGQLVSEILDAIPDLFRLRLSSVDCAEIDDELFERLANDPRVAPYLHLSLQAGDDMILKRMKRRHTRADAISLSARLREERAEIAYGADLIAGFPTETEAMFAQSLALVDEVGLNFVHVFPYSPKAGTPAARMPQLTRKVIAGRARRLRDKARAATAAFLETLVGAREDAVIESGGRARLGNFAAVDLTRPAGPPGTVARLHIIARENEMLKGAPIG
ncbi:MAG: tRNA (N(6)-L-threonylcarbamoyladenosine(37)-C(2))-methylthiotransferase MtaB [Parvularculaceae bacterium]